MAHDTKGQLQNLLDQSGHRLTRCIRVVRRDGTTYRITDHDSVISFPENWLDASTTDKFGDPQEYSPVDGWDASNARAESAMKKNNIELKGAFGGTFVTTNDIMTGLWNDAVVDDFICDWRYPFKGAFRHSKYRLTDFQLNDEVWTAQASTMMSELYRKSGKTYGKTCWHAFGDGNCGVNLNQSGVTEFHCDIAFLSASPIHNSQLLFSDVSGGWSGASNQAVDYFKAGHLRWTSGDNNGQVYPIKNSSNPTAGTPAMGMIFYAFGNPVESSQFQVTNTAGTTWTFLWTDQHNTGDSAGTNSVYVSRLPAWNGSAVATESINAINSASCGITARNFDTLTDTFPTNATSYQQNRSPDWVVMMQDVDGVAGNTTIVATSLPTATLFDFGDNGLQAGVNLGSGVDDGLMLQYPTRADVQIGDTFTLFAGCDKLLSTCASTLVGGGVDNHLNFGGFPFMIGTTQLLKTGNYDNE